MARPQRPAPGKPKEGEITIKEGKRFIFRNGQWYPEGKGEMGSSANTKEAEKALAELRAKNKGTQTGTTTRTTAKPPTKPPSKPQSKPTPGANKAGYEGPGSRGQDPGGYAGKPKKKSLKEQVDKLKKMGTSSKRFERLAKEAREATEKRKNQQKQTRGSRKPGSMY